MVRGLVLKQLVYTLLCFRIVHNLVLKQLVYTLLCFRMVHGLVLNNWCIPYFVLEWVTVWY